jgi:hypothetical protein
MMPPDQKAASICGPVNMHQAVPSLYKQVAGFARGCGSELDRSLVGTDSHESSLRTVRGQAPEALWIDLRGAWTFAASHIETKSLTSISL